MSELSESQPNFVSLAKQKIAVEGRTHLFNNFYMNLSTKTWQEHEDNLKTRKFLEDKNIMNDTHFMHVFNKTLDTPWEEIMIKGKPDFYESEEKKVPERRYSEVFLKQTPREFYHTINVAITVEGIAQDELNNLLSDKSKPNRLNYLLEPVVFNLLAKGYSFQDLFS